MERLKQAMERARAERRHLNPLPHPTAPGRERHRASCEEAATAHARIHYVQTAQLSVEPQSRRNGPLPLLEEHWGQAGVHEGAAAYRTLQTRILRRLRAESHRTLAITSPGVGDGKTTTAINLAISLARGSDRNVLLVDCDLKRSAIRRYLSGYDALGLIDHLTGNAELADVLVNPGIERLTILPGGRRIRHASARLSAPRVVQLIEDLKRHQAEWLILFDMPPLFDDDVIACLPYIDAVLLVVADGRVSRRALVDAHELLGEQCIGMVLNKA